MKMGRNIVAAFILILAFTLPAVCENRSLLQTNEEYVSDFRALELRISGLEKAIEKITARIMQEARGTLGFYREAKEVMKESRLRIGSLEREMPELETLYPAIQKLRSGVDGLGAKMRELEKKGIAAEGAEEDTTPVVQKTVKERPAPDLTKVRRVPSAVARRSYSPCRGTRQEVASSNVRYSRQRRVSRRGIGKRSAVLSTVVVIGWFAAVYYVRSL